MCKWIIVDEDTCRVVRYCYGTKKDAIRQLEELKEAIKPGDKKFWHVFNLYRRLENNAASETDA